MTESTSSFLTSLQAAARLGVKPATLYAYVSRGLLPSHRSADGRRSLFDPADLARLEKRSAERRGSPADVIVASELSLVDTAQGRLYYRGLDVLQACRDATFEEIVWWLWTGSVDRTTPWRVERATRLVAIHAQTLAESLRRHAQPIDRLRLIAQGVAAAHGARTGTAAASDVMACLVDALPGAGLPGGPDPRMAVRLSQKLGSCEITPPLLGVLNAALILTCEHGLSRAALISRLTVSNGGGVASAVAAAMAAADSKPYAALESALATTASEGTMRAIDALDAEAIDAGFSKATYRSGDPRAVVLLEALSSAAPERVDVVASLAGELEQRSGGPPTLTYALAAVSWTLGMDTGSGACLSFVAKSAGWIAHALEEARRPTPFRPRLAYTGPAPRAGLPPRALDAVRDYLSRE